MQRSVVYILLSLLGVVFLLALSACNSASATVNATEPVDAENSEVTSPAPTATATQTPTPTTLPPTVILLAPPGSDAVLVAELESTLTELAESDGLSLEVLSELSAVDIDESVRLVVAVAPDAGILPLAASAPGTQFLAVGITGLEPGINLSVIGASGDRPDQQGFLAGFLAATITPGWRVGVISPGDTASGRAGKGAFMNGVVFFCGLCRPANPPYLEYPQFFNLAAGAGQVDQQAAADYLISNAVHTVYVFPEAGDEFLYGYLADAGMVLIGGDDPPALVKGQWAATIQPDWVTPVREIWPRLLAGEGGISLDVLLVIENRNPDLFSPGRQRLVEETMSDLLGGYIDTGVDPVTGEPR
jgi:hypothetical protein